MEEKYQNIQWVVQKNLTSVSDFEQLKEACQNIGVNFIGVDVIPFTPELPAFDTKRKSIIYGSTTFNQLAFENEALNKGLFFDEEKFSIENYIEKWGRYMLNYDATVTTFQELIEGVNYSNDKLLFIRPDDDSKSFAGEVKRFEEIKDWYESLKQIQNINLSLESKIVVNEPFSLKFEWRLWLVNKKVVAASKYREYFKLKKQEGCPAEVKLFAEDRCREYTPHDVFVMDICLCGDEYFIVECGCMNGAGFYKADIQSIVSNVSDYFVSMP